MKNLPLFFLIARLITLSSPIALAQDEAITKLFNEYINTIMKNLFTAFVLFGFSCSPKLSIDWTKEDFKDRSFSKIAVIGISKNLKARVEFEETAVELFKKHGINAVVGIDIFPDKMMDEEQKPDNLIKIITRNDLDGIITMSLIDTEEIIRYEGGGNYVVSVGYMRFDKYYIQRYATVHNPGYFVSSKEYLIEAVLYDLKGELYEGKETLVWKGQSSLVDPSSIESAATSFTKKMVNHLVKNRVVEAK